MKIIFATWLYDRTLGSSLTKVKAENRLLSYHFLCDQEITLEQLKEYVITGELDTRKKK